METGDVILVGGLLLVGGALIWKLSTAKPAQPPATPPGPVPDPSGTSPGSRLYTGSNLGPFDFVRSLPFVGQAYGVLAPVNNGVVQPLVRGLNRSAPVTAVNQVLGGKVTTTVKKDGTIERHVQDGWYARNIGSPISHAGTSIVHAIGSIF